MLLFTFAFAATSACSDLSQATAARDTSVAEVPAVPDSTPTPAPTPGVYRWSDRTIWPDSVLPRAGSDVTIPAGRTVLLDVVTPPLGSVNVLGALEPDTIATELRVSTIYVRGKLTAGSADAPHRGRFVITLLERENDPDPELGKGIIVFPGATLDLFGERRTPWLQLGATVQPGATSLTMERAVDWRAGDMIVIASSSLVQEDAELRRVVRVEGTRVVLDRALQKMHFGELQTIAGRTLDERAEVGLLTRNIVIRGDSLSERAGHGGHVMLLRGAFGHVDGVELYRMGQRNKLARYPFHWHVAGSVPGQFIRNSSVWRTFNRCITIHGTHDAHVEKNVCYDHEGHGYFLEDGIETGNTLRENLGLTSRIASLIPSDRMPATFWITNQDNTFENNVSAGSLVSGFWISPPTHPTGPSATSSVWPLAIPMRRFDGNVVHSAEHIGVMVEGDTHTNGYYSIDVRPREGGDPNGKPVTSVYSRLRAYKNVLAFWVRGDHARLDDAVLADNRHAAQIADANVTSESSIAHSLIIGRSALSAYPDKYPVVGGFVLYDGAVSLDDVTFANFAKSSGSYAIRAVDRFDGRMSPRNDSRRLRFVDVPMDSRLYLVPTPTYDGERQALIIDHDGSLGGNPGHTLVSASDPFMHNASCQHSAISSAVQTCTSHIVGVRVEDGASDVAPADVSRDDGITTRLGGYAPSMLSMNLQEARTYFVRPVGGPSLGFTVEIEALRDGASITVAMPWTRETVSAKLRSTGDGPVTQVATLDALANSQTTAMYLDTAAKLLYVRAIGTAGLMKDYVWVQRPSTP
jgi:cell surface hyaluronidase